VSRRVGGPSPPKFRTLAGAWRSENGPATRAGQTLLPGGLLFQAGKNETGYLIDEATMAAGAPPVYKEKVCQAKTEGNGEGSFGGDAYAAGTIYVPCNDGVRALAASDVTGVLLPASALFLDRPMPPARALLDAGAAVALATDFNPGSSFTESLPFVCTLACTQLHVAPEEALLSGRFARYAARRLTAFTLAHSFTLPVR